MVVRTIMIRLFITITALLVITFINTLAWAQTVVTPIRITCQTNSNLNTKLIQLRSDAGDTFKPPILTIMDPQRKPFKEIVSHQIVYGDDNITIVFVAAIDSENRFGVFKVDIKNAIKTNSSQFINLLPPKLRSYVNYSRDFNFSLFSLLKGNLLYPSNDNGQWRLISLRSGSVINEWTHSALLFNPVLKDEMATWTGTTGDASQLYVYNFKTNSKEIVTFKDVIQVLNINKNEVILANIFILDANKRIIRIQNYINGSTKILYELDASMALFGNFVSSGTNLIFTSEKTFVSGTQIQVVEAYLNVLDVTKQVITQRIKYPPILVELMKKQPVTNLKLLNSPMFNQNEILFSLDEMGGIVKYEFKTANWFYIRYSSQENTCFNPSYVSVLGR